MIRVYFVFEDPMDDEQVNLSFVDVPTSTSNTRISAGGTSG
jgi:hypothetical protein